MIKMNPPTGKGTIKVMPCKVNEMLDKGWTLAKQIKPTKESK